MDKIILSIAMQNFISLRYNEFATMAVKLKDGFKGSRSIVLPAAVKEELRLGAYTSLLYVTDIGHYPKARYHYRRREGGAAEYILIYCTGGKGWIECGGARHKLQSGNFFIIPRCREHTYGADENDPWSIYWIHFTGTLADSFGGGFDHACEISSAEDSRISNRLELFEELYKSLESGYSEAQLNYSCSVLGHLLGSFKYIDAFRATGKMEEGSLDMIDRCRHYMLENIEKQISLADICAYIGRSQSYCSEMFRRFTGMSPVQYLQTLRIQTAAHLMDVTSMKINQVCLKVGISDPYYFSRLFSKTMGMSPKEYRRSVEGCSAHR